MKSFDAYLAEGIATFTLVFIGAGAILADPIAEGGIVAIALAHGLVIMCMVYATGHISGAHINPAVTIGMWVTKKIDTKDGISYIIAQLLGATVGAFALKSFLVNADAALNLGTPALASGVSVLNGIFIEAILTFFLVFVIFATAVDKRAPAGMYGLAIGMTITADILIGGPLTGAAMNPARAFGPALVSGYFVNHLVYWIGPIVGGIVGAVTYDKFLLKKK